MVRCSITSFKLMQRFYVKKNHKFSLVEILIQQKIYFNIYYFFLQNVQQFVEEFDGSFCTGSLNKEINCQIYVRHTVNYRWARALFSVALYYKKRII